MKVGAEGEGYLEESRGTRVVCKNLKGAVRWIEVERSSGYRAVATNRTNTDCNDEKNLHSRKKRE